MFAGYLDAAPAPAFVDGGWSAPAISVRRLTIVDRLKDIIIRGGTSLRKRSRRSRPADVARPYGGPDGDVSGCVS
jgi:hypothetical protein